MFKKKNKTSILGGKARWKGVSKKKRSKIMKALRAKALSYEKSTTK